DCDILSRRVSLISFFEFVVSKIMQDCGRRLPRGTGLAASILQSKIDICNAHSGSRWIARLSRQRVKQSSRVADIGRGCAALDRRQDWLQQRAQIVVGFSIAPEPGEIVGCPEFEQAALLAPRDLDRLPEACLGVGSIRLCLSQRKLPAQSMQLGEPKAFAGPCDKSEALRQI